MTQMRMVAMIRTARIPGAKETATSAKTTPSLSNLDPCPAVWGIGLVESSVSSDVIVGL